MTGYREGKVYEGDRKPKIRSNRDVIKSEGEMEPHQRRSCSRKRNEKEGA
jgi:hypothetical protein